MSAAPSAATTPPDRVLGDVIAVLVADRVIEIIPRVVYEHLEGMARRCVPRDSHDWAPVALALALDAAILTGELWPVDRSGVTPGSYTGRTMPSKHPRIAVTTDSELAGALERVRVATGTREADATLVRRLAVAGAQAQLEARDERLAAAEALFGLMDDGGFDLDLDAIDRLNAPAHSSR
jgi:hypothetical protein